MRPTGTPPVGQFFSVCGQICGQGVPGRTKQAEIVTRMAGLKQIMEIFKAINQPLSSEQRVRWYKQRGLSRFFGEILTIYSRFCSVSFTLRHSLKTVFPRVPHLSVAVYVVRRIDAPEEAPYKHNEALYNSLAFHFCISPFIPIDFRLLFRYCVACKSPTKYRNQEGSK